MTAVSFLKKRRDFLKTQRFGRRLGGTGLSLIASKQMSASRVGITISKKVGKAHARNLIKRRIRHILQLHPPSQIKRDLVVLLNPRANQMSFEGLREEYCRLLDRIHQPH